MKKNYNHAPVILYASLITVSAVYSGGVDTVTVPIRKYSMGLIKYTTSSNDGKRIFIRGGDGTLRLYDFSSGNMIKTYPALATGTMTARFFPDSRHCVLALNVSYGGSDGGSAFMLCDAENGDSLKSFFELNSKYSTFEFSPDDTRLVIGFNNHRLLVLSDCFDSLKMTTATDSTVRAIHFSGDGTRFLTLTRDTVVTIRNTDSLERVRKISKKESILST